MKYLFLLSLVMYSTCYSMSTLKSTSELTKNRLDSLFEKVQQVGPDYKEGFFLKQIEALLSSSLSASYALPVNAQTNCFGGTFLCLAAEHNLPFLSAHLTPAADQPNLAKAYLIAASKGNEEVLDDLLISKPPLDLQEDGMGTGLHNAASKGKKEVVRKIISHCLANGKNEVLQARDARGRTPSDYALKAEDFEILELISNGLDRSN